MQKEVSGKNDPKVVHYKVIFIDFYLTTIWLPLQDYIALILFQVLLLTMDDESSSGVNLTTANHAIFVHPLLAIGQQQYDAYETQVSFIYV